MRNSNLPPIFMPRNEEEIMRILIALDQQLKFVNDKSQVYISFDEQTAKSLYFTVIIVRILKGEPAISALLKSSTFFKYLHDRTRKMGLIRKKYQKEATVFRVRFSKENFFRKDGSIDLYKARSKLAHELTLWLGEFRDFNGGTLKKQNELLNLVMKELKSEELSVENFFYSLIPVVIRSILEPEAFITLYKLLFDNKTMHFDGRFTYVVMKSKAKLELEKISYALYEIYQGETNLVQGFMKMSHCYCMGFIYRSQDPLEQENFQALISSFKLSIEIPA